MNIFFVIKDFLLAFNLTCLDLKLLGLNTHLLREFQITGVMDIEETSEKIATAMNM